MILTDRGVPFARRVGAGDDALALVLDAVEQDIVRSAGPSGERTETFGGVSQLDRVVLKGTAESIVSVTETGGSTVRVLDPTDYQLDPDGYTLYRLTSGSNPRRYWWARSRHSTCRSTTRPCGSRSSSTWPGWP